MPTSRFQFTYLVLVFLCFGCSIDPFKNELKVTVYTSPDEVETAEAGPRTWLPCLLPDAFESYTEMHRVDASHRAGVFEVAPSTASEFGATLRDLGEPLSNPNVARVHSFRTRRTNAYIDQFQQFVRQGPWYRVSCPERGTFDYFIDSESYRIYYVSVH